MKHGFKYDFARMETVSIDKCNCPFCFSSDRERLYLLFLENYLKESKNRTIRILDFAPNPAFSSALKKNTSVKYESTDLFREDVDLKLNICNMESIKDSTYDVIICSHIIEHVENPKKALSELCRILTKGGIAIIMVPLYWDVKETIEEASHTTEEERWKNYGQYDHVRLYSKADFLLQVQNAGFTIKEFLSRDFPENLVNLYAISPNSVLYVCSK